MNKKLYLIRKYVWATSAQAAIRNEKDYPVEDVWVDEEWKRNPISHKDAIGYASTT